MRTRRYRVLAACIVLGCALLWAAPRAHADEPAEPPEYRTLVDEALREYGAKNFEEARSLFHRANELFPSARTQRGLGMAQFELRNYGESIRELEAALASRVRPLPEPLRRETEALLERARNFVALITLRTDPEDARLRIDGVPTARRADRPIVLNVGDRELELSAPGYLAARRTLSVRGGERETLELRLEPERALATDGDGTRDASPGRSWAKSPWLWVGVALVVGGAATATGILLTRERESAPYYGGTSDTVVTAR